MSAHGPEVAGAAPPPAVETHPRAVKAIGDAVLRAVACLDAVSQVAVLKWALVEARRQARTRKPGFAGYTEPHAVTRGLHDAEIACWKAEGLSWAVMGARLGCGPTCVRNRGRVLRRVGG